MNTLETLEQRLKEVRYARSVQNGYPMGIDDILAALPALIAVAKAAEDVLTRWDSPTWKNAESTAETMAILRARLATLKEQGNG